MKKIKTVISILIVTVMIFSIFPLTPIAFTYGDLEYEINDGEVTITRYTGESATFKIPLTIDDYPVTTIGDYAFSNNDALTSIVIPDCVTSIGYCAFHFCSNLTSVYIPYSVYSIGESAFSNCKSLKSVALSDCIIKISRGMFSGCSSLSDVVIPDSVQEIGNNAFSYCSSLSSVVLPDSVTTIENSAFSNCSNLTNVFIGKGVKKLESNVFEKCYNLKKITISNNLDYIDFGSFIDCSNIEYNKYDNALYLGNQENPYLALMKAESETITDIKINENTKVIAGGAFYMCSNITGIKIPKGVVSIGSCAFELCSNLTDITLPDSILTIGWSAFRDCDSLTSIKIPDSVLDIGAGAFYRCYNLNEVHIGKWIENTNKEKNLSITQLTANNIIISDSVKKIGNFAFYNYTSLENITIPDSVISIGDFAFSSDQNNWGDYKSNNLERIILGINLKKIGNSAFAGCNKLIKVLMGSEEIEIGRRAFVRCKNLEEVTLSKKILKMESEVFSGCEKIKYNFFSDAFYLGSTNNPYLVLIKISNNSIDHIIINEDTNVICDKAFSGCNDLNEITIPENVIYIGEAAFQQCYNLKTINFLCRLSAIERYTFEDCHSLTSIEIPEDVKNIDREAFRSCSNLKTVIVPDNIESIGDDVFMGCDSLDYYEYDNLLYIGSRTNPNLVFIRASDTSITNASIKEGTRIINGGSLYIGYSSSFQYCNELESVVIPDSVVSIGFRAFNDCSNLVNINIPDSVVRIGDNAFYGCVNLTGIIIHENLEYIGAGVFGSCDALHYNKYDNALYLGNENNPYYLLVKAKDDDIDTVIIHKETKVIAGAAFANCKKLEKVIIPDGVVVLGDSLFACSSLRSLLIPESVQWIYNYLIDSCYDIYYINYRGTDEQWEKITFGEHNYDLLKAGVIFNCKHEHEFEKWVVSKKPNCLEAGEIICMCSICGETQAKAIAALGHTFIDGACIRCGIAYVPTFIPGDCNGDGEVNNKDVVSLFRFVSGIGEIDSAIADINNDGEVDNKDVVTLFRQVSTD